MTDCDAETSVVDWILDHPATQPVFENLGIDHSCGGKSLEFACQQRGLLVADVLRILHETIREAEQTSSD